MADAEVKTARSRSNVESAELLSRDQAADALNVGANTISDYVTAWEKAREHGVPEDQIDAPFLRAMPREKPNGRIRVPRAEIDAHIARELAKV